MAQTWHLGVWHAGTKGQHLELEDPASVSTQQLRELA